ncbi:helicase-exonuclease AddAB subunit AddA [Anaerovorax odorimutans]|uniref:helicase-exonuclease AddAB subunit AddA n=1 Tax=Anaerovorax odorimutans TaxID=109327 RepID=UPI00041044A2|nr:helicase-exonuclease AddAB subunit AddA [Anaerovorax odorimutans]
MKWTKSQKEAIEIRNKNVLVSAAAGSGKTAVLVERIMQIIIKDQVPIDKMLIVTFTNAAASEMREKIIKSITEEIKVCSNNVENKNQQEKEQFLRIQLNLINKANISTFHAFSMEVIRRYFYLINIEPNFKICDEAQKIILQSDAMEELFYNLFQIEDEEFIWFLNQYAQTKNEKNVKDMILQTYEFAQSIPDSYGWLNDKVNDLNCSKEEFMNGKTFREIKVYIDSRLNSAREYFSKVENLLDMEGITSLISKCDLELNNINQLIEELHRGDFKQFALNLKNIKFQTYRTTAAEKEEYESIKELVSNLRDKGKSIIKKLISQYCIKTIDEYVTELNETHRAAEFLIKLVVEFDNIYKSKKAEKNLIDFNDIEHYALDILSYEEAALEYREKFNYIFIDEYQDSNVVQETLINKIKRENNLFMVGDVKQSIYKFRLAEPEIFISKYEKFKLDNNKNDKKIDLNMNFRSKGNVICAVNEIFSKIMQKDVSGLEYDKDAALYKGVSYEGQLDYPVELHIVDDMNLEDVELDDEIAEMKKAEVEAFTAARIIKEAKGSFIYDEKKGITRTLTNRDIVILLRGARGTSEIYYEALLKEGIPSFIDSSDGYFDTVEIEIFLNLLRVIDNRKQDIPFLSILRSQLFKFTIEELIEIRLINKQCTYYRAFDLYVTNGKNEALKDKCRNALDKISEWNKASTFMPLEELLWKLLRETAFYEYIGAIPGGIQRQANLRALIDKAVQFQNTQMKGLFQFITYIEAVKKEKVPTGQVKLLGEKDDVVRIMTIHKSKGLEFPFVIIGGLGKKFIKDNKIGRIGLHKDIGLGLRWIDKENHSFKKTIIQSAIEQRKSNEDMAEEIRVLYVAFTRAMDKLVLLGSVTDIDKTLKKYEVNDGYNVEDSNCYLDFLLPILKETNIKFITHNKSDINSIKVSNDEQKLAVKKLLKGNVPYENKNLLNEISRRLEFEYAYKSALKLKSKFTVSELNKEKKKGFYGSLEVPKFTKSNDEFSGAEKGTILHKVMEHIDFSCTNKDEIEAFIDHLVNREILTRKEANTINVNKIIKFINSEIGKRAALSKNIYKEVSFNIAKEIEGETVIVQGTIDCYFEEDGKYVLLDYKSNYLWDEKDQEAIDKLVDGYRYQIELYREALEKIREIEVKESYLYLFSIDREIKL